MKIVTAVVNNPTFIEIQHYTLQKYVKGQYEFIVFNDAKDFPDFTNNDDATIKQQIEDVCEKLNIPCINIPNSHHKQSLNAAHRCADSMNYILEFQKKYPDKYLLLDSDMFLVDHFDTDKYQNYDCAIVLQSRIQRNQTKVNYFWNGIYYFDMLKMNNKELLNWNVCIDCDVGGMMQEWLKKQGTANIYFMKHLSSCSWDANDIPKNLEGNATLMEFFKNDIRNVDNKFFCEIYDDTFLHYRAGGNWRMEGLELHMDLSQKMKSVIFS